jgi:hypothetical protein
MLTHAVDTKIPGNPEKPCSECAIGAEFACAAQNAEKSLGGCVFGIGPIAEHSEGVAENPLTV